MVNHHEVDKNKMKNDIVLTVALFVSLILVRVVMHLTYLCTSEYNYIIFFISSFVLVKITYHLFGRIVDFIIKCKNRGVRR